MPGGTNHMPLDDRLLAVSETDWAYLAGIMDGEGHFAAHLSGTHTSPGLTVSMAEPEVPTALHSIFGGRFTKRLWNGRTTWVWRWHLGGHRNVAFACRKLRAHLRMKNDECAALLAFLDHCLSWPKWEVPTCRVPAPERRRRSAMWAQWQADRRSLAGRVKHVRSARKAVTRPTPEELAEKNG